MRRWSTSAVLLTAVLLGGCSGETASDDPTDSPSAKSSEACEEVRAGIDAFNEGDYATTVARFRKAIPLAQDQADADDSQRSDDLLEAVRYYADLDPADYPESARSSEEFAKYKAITLGQCVPVEQPGDDEPDVQA